MLGLALVVGIIALLLGGTLKGLDSYSNTMKSIDSKLQEQTEAVKVMEAVNDLTVVENGTVQNDEPDRLRRKIAGARKRLAGYEERLEETLKRRRDPDQGHTELVTIKKLHSYFDALELAIK